jgi:hypothetical protein
MIKNINIYKTMIVLNSIRYSGRSNFSRPRLNVLRQRPKVSRPRT